MKKLLGALALITVLLPATAFAQGITGSAHDLSGAGLGTDEICVFCHTPHNADTTVADAPLWNHELSAVASYTLYSSATLDAALNQPSGVSKLCLSCHDGTVAVDSYGGAVGTTMIGAIRATANFGSDLSNDHPISFTYDTALASADGELFDPSLQASGLGGTIDADLLFSGNVECASCHDVHNADGNTYLLRKANTGSALCLTCHNK